MSEIGYEKIPENNPKLHQLRQEFHSIMMEATRTTERISPNRFPGTMALTLSRRHLRMIASSDYVVLEKSDGTRYMLFAIQQFVFLIDRLMDFYLVQPNPNILIDREGNTHDRTVLDGELVFNQLTEQWEYLIYDAVSIHGDVSVARMDFRKRMAQVELHVVAQRVILSNAPGLLRLRVKDYFEKKDLRRLFNRIHKDDRGEYIYLNDDRRDGPICNENDGCIFTPVGMEYTVKSCEALLKWKPPHLNSVDFQLLLEPMTDQRTNTQTVKASIAYKGERGTIKLRQVHFPSKQRLEWMKNFNRYHESIVELSYDSNAGEWRYIRQRDDKTTPNFASTVIDTMESSCENLGREELVRFMEKYAKAPPESARTLVEDNTRTREICRVRNDLFDADSKPYLLATPNSTTPAPMMEVPARRNRDRRHRGPNRSAHDAQPQQHSGRAQPDYSDDV